jgi:hypothetical protein
MDKYAESEMTVSVGKGLWERKTRETVPPLMPIKLQQGLSEKMCINTGNIFH